MWSLSKSSRSHELTTFTHRGQRNLNSVSTVAKRYNSEEELNLPLHLYMGSTGKPESPVPPSWRTFKDGLQN